MASLLAVLAILAAVVSGVPSPQGLMSDITILIDNDLQGEKLHAEETATVLNRQ